MSNKELSIHDFAEDDFNDPIALLDAIKRRNIQVDTVDTMENKSPKMLLSDIEREYGVSVDELINAIRLGKLNPISIIPVFEKSDVVDFIKSNSLNSILYDSFMEELQKMSMNYSYKPILILALLQTNDNNSGVKIDTIIDYYFDYYHSRNNKTLIIEKATSSFVKHPDNRNMARKTLLTYPVRILSKKGFIEYNKCTDTVCFNNNLFSKFNNSALTHIKSLCEKNLEQYYSTIK